MGKQSIDGPELDRIERQIKMAILAATKAEQSPRQVTEEGNYFSASLQDKRYSTIDRRVSKSGLSNYGPTSSVIAPNKRMQTRRISQTLVTSPSPQKEQRRAAS